MFTYDIDKFLTGHAFAFMFIFARVGTVMMLMPGIGEAYVPVRIRLMFALCLCFVLTEPLMGHMPPIPNDIGHMIGLIFFEIVIGLFFGTIMRFIMDALETTGTIIGLQTGLSSATVFNPSLAAQSPLPSAFLGVVGIVMIFVSGLDHMILRSIVATYDAFPPGGQLIPGDMVQMVSQTMGKSFALGIQLSMPFTMIALLMFTALGMMQKLMPSIQLFMISMPVQIWGGLFLIAVTIGSIMAAWLAFFDATLNSFFVH